MAGSVLGRPAPATGEDDDASDETDGFGAVALVDVALGGGAVGVGGLEHAAASNAHRHSQRYFRLEC